MDMFTYPGMYYTSPAIEEWHIIEEWHMSPAIEEWHRSLAIEEWHRSLAIEAQNIAAGNRILQANGISPDVVSLKTATERATAPWFFTTPSMWDPPTPIELAALVGGSGYVEFHLPDAGNQFRPLPALRFLTEQESAACEGGRLHDTFGMGGAIFSAFSLDLGGKTERVFAKILLGKDSKKTMREIATHWAAQQALPQDVARIHFWTFVEVTDLNGGSRKYPALVMEYLPNGAVLKEGEDGYEMREAKDLRAEITFALRVHWELRKKADIWNWDVHLGNILRVEGGGLKLTDFGNASFGQDPNVVLDSYKTRDLVGARIKRINYWCQASQHEVVDSIMDDFFSNNPEADVS